MKRTSMRKPLPPRTKSVPQRGTGRGAITAVDAEVRAVPKGERVLDEEYRRWVATFPCMRCGIQGYSQAAHPNFGRGQRQKADDTDCFPLCCDRPGTLGCHTMHDQLVKITLTERREREQAYIKAMRKIVRLAQRPHPAEMGIHPKGGYE